MTSASGGRATRRRRIEVNPAPLRLDVLSNPFGPSVRVLEALASAQHLWRPDLELDRRLLQRIAESDGVDPSRILPAPGADQLIVALLSWQRQFGGVEFFGPTDPAAGRLARLVGVAATVEPRSHRFAVEVTALLSGDLPSGQMSLVQSPNDPSGTLLAPVNAVRLARTRRCLVVDERHVAYAPRTLLPLANEFDNIVVVRSFENWAGLIGLPVAYAITPPKLASEIGEFLIATSLPQANLLAAIASFEDSLWMAATVKHVRDEAHRLFRMLRKLNMLSPIPSWGNYVSFALERGDPECLAGALDEAGIAVYRWPDDAFRHHFRVSAVSSEATTALRDCLIGFAAKL